MKRIFALLIAVLMLMSCFAALADEEAPATPTNNLTKDAKISVSGLDEGDKVDFYRVLKFSEDASKTGGWITDTGFSLTDAEIQKMLTLDENGLKVTVTDANRDQYGIDETLAGKIGDMAESATVKYNADTVPAVVVEDGVATVTGPDEGLYIAIIHPAKAGTMYNPVFVGADYSSSNDTNGQEAVSTLSYSPASMAKKTTITLDKKAKDRQSNDADFEGTVRVGDTVDFTVETTIPEFADNYTSARFFITDVLSKGLDLDLSSVKVYGGWESEREEGADELSELTKNYSVIEGGAAVEKTDGYEVSDQSNNDGDSYKVDFKSAYLLGLNAAQKITVKYNALVTSKALTSVNLETNTVTLNFSNNPTDGDGKGVLKDETKHYTFDIDGKLLGGGEYPTFEVVKIGIGPDGKEITGVINVHTEERPIGALEGAEFVLYTKYAKDANDNVRYENTYYGANDVIVSGSDGRLTIKGAKVPGIRGLDAGVYWLVETKAPAGYIKQQDPVKIEIKTTFKDVEHKDTINGIEVKWTVKELKTYSIEIDGIETASYTFTNEEDHNVDTFSSDSEVASQGDTVIGAGGLIGSHVSPSDIEKNKELAGKVKNTQGVELPHTGGIGTTLFYIGGSILVLAAVILLVTKRRMGGND